MDSQFHWIYELINDLKYSLSTGDFKQFDQHLKRSKQRSLKRYIRTTLKTLERYADSIKNACHYTLSNGHLEGINNKIKTLKRTGFGYRNFDNLRTRIMISFNLTKDQEKTIRPLTFQEEEQKKEIGLKQKEEFIVNSPFIISDQHYLTKSQHGTSELKDHKLTFRGPHAHAVATVEPCKGESVPALVWQITPSDEKALDRYEGWPHLYRKETMKIKIDKKTINAMVYIMNEGRPLEQPSCYYYSTILEGYNRAGFDVEYLRRAVEHSYEKNVATLEKESNEER